MKSVEGVKRRVGRPPRHPSGRAQHNLTFRTRGELRTELATRAERNGRSISEEIERRLEQSFERERRRGTAHDEALLDLLGALLQRIERTVGKRWDESAVARDIATKAIPGVMRAWSESFELPDKITAALLTLETAKWADELVLLVKGSLPSPSLENERGGENEILDDRS